MKQSTVVKLGQGHPEWQFAPFGKSYHRAARRELTTLLRRSTSTGVDACPILFLYRHAVELYLKSIIIVANTIYFIRAEPKIIVAGRGLNKTHNLSDLLTASKRALKSIGVKQNSRVDGLGTFANLASLIQEIGKTDERSFAFRYPITTTGEPSIPRGMTVDIKQFGEIVDVMVRYLAACNSFLESRWHAMVDAHSEAEEQGLKGQWPEVVLSGFRG